MLKLNQEQSNRLKGITKKGLLGLGLGFCYFLFVRLTGWGIPCLFKVITGKYCPGCGITRMFLALLRLDFSAAAGHNLLVLCLLPFGVFLFIYKSVLYIKNGKNRNSAAENVFYILAFVLCIAFFI